MFFNYVRITWQTIVTLRRVIRNHFPFYQRDFFHHISWALLIAWNFCIACLRFFHAYYHHFQFIDQLQLTKYKGMLDVYCNADVPTRKQDQLEAHEHSDHNDLSHSHFPLSSLAMELPWPTLDQHVDYSNSTFIDFGCGVGVSMLFAMQKPFHEVVGVEIDTKTTQFCQQNIDQFMMQHKDLVKCSKVAIENMDMIKYKVRPPHRSSIVLFMYEPLWTVSKSIAVGIYRKVLSNILQNCSVLYVVYYFAGKYNGDALPAINSLPHEVLFSTKYPSLFFGTHEDMFVFKITNKK